MKQVIVLLMLLLTGCSNCNIPNGLYKTTGGSEYFVELNLEANSCEIIVEEWQPGNYESRSSNKVAAKCQCQNNDLEIITKSGVSMASWQAIGPNPLGLEESTQALVIQSSKDTTLSSMILYPEKP